MGKVKKKITQAKIASLANIGPVFLSHIIRGRKRCPPDVAVRLEAITGVSRVTWVWGTSEEKKSGVKQFMYSAEDLHGY